MVKIKVNLTSIGHIIAITNFVSTFQFSRIVDTKKLKLKGCFQAKGNTLG